MNRQEKKGKRKERNILTTLGDLVAPIPRFFTKLLFKPESTEGTPTLDGSYPKKRANSRDYDATDLGANPMAKHTPKTDQNSSSSFLSYLPSFPRFSSPEPTIEEAGIPKAEKKGVFSIRSKKQPEPDPNALCIEITEENSAVQESKLIGKIKDKLKNVAKFAEGDFREHSDYKSKPNEAILGWNAPTYTSTDREIAIPNIHLKESKKGRLEMTLYIPEPGIDRRASIDSTTSAAATVSPAIASNFAEKIRALSDKTTQAKEAPSDIPTAENKTTAQRAFVAATLEAFTAPKVTIKKECKSQEDVLQVLSAIEMMVNNSPSGKPPLFNLQGIKIPKDLADTLPPDVVTALQDHNRRGNNDPKSTLSSLIGQVQPLRDHIEAAPRSRAPSMSGGSH